MSIWVQENFDYVTADIDEDYYFPYMNDMIARARDILSDKSSADIAAMARTLAIFIELEKVSIDHEVALQCHKSEDADEFVTSSLYSPFRLVKMYFEDRYGEYSALAFFDFSPFLDPGIEIHWHPAEIYSTLVISLIAGIITMWDATDEDWQELSDQEMHFHADHPLLTEDELARSDFIWRQTCELSLGALGALHHAEAVKAEYEREIIAQKSRNEKAIKLNQEKHQETYETKRLVIAEWERRKSDFRSAAKAGLYFYSWINEQKSSSAEQKLKIHEPSTITKWIRDAAKAKGIRLR